MNDGSNAFPCDLESPSSTWEATLSTTVEQWISHLKTRALWNQAQMKIMKIIREEVRDLFRHCCELINVRGEELDLIQSACKDEYDEGVDAWINECMNANVDVDAMACNKHLAFLKTMPRDKQLQFLKRLWTFVSTWHHEEMARDKQLAFLRECGPLQKVE
jgi:hypothetical protein